MKFTQFSKLSVIVPSTNGATCNEGTIAQQAQFVDAFKSLFSDLYGGATARPCVGAWKMEDGEIVNENNIEVFSLIPTDATESEEFDKVIELVNKMKSTMKQEAILISLETARAVFA